jgi:xanthine dehydrogenase accessory factor
VEDLVDAVRRRAAAGEDLAVGRVLRVEGFSTLPASEGGFLLFGVDGEEVAGGPLGILGGAPLAEAARSLLSSPAHRLGEVSLEVGDKDAVAAGLACGGRVDLVLQRASAVPAQLWDRLAAREPVAMLTWLEAPRAALVGPGGCLAGEELDGELLDVASQALREGRNARRVLEHEGSRVLVEAWVPDPRLVVVGDGELFGAISAQAALLGWETRASDGLVGLESLLAWAGASGALIVLSHDPHVDVPAMASGLARGVGYVGALGSRHTQSRRAEQLAALGLGPSDLARLHRPIGLDLGGRRAPEVALAIVAEILACHHGRTGTPLRATTGPIHG